MNKTDPNINTDLQADFYVYFKIVQDSRSNDYISQFRDYPAMSILQNIVLVKY